MSSVYSVQLTYTYCRDSLSLYRYVTVVAWVSVVFCVAAVFTQTIHCLPLEKNWQIVPDPGSECSVRFSLALTD